MPQKRNPRPLDRLRSSATAVIGSGYTVILNAHNTNSGMNDYRDGSQTLLTAEHAREMYRLATAAEQRQSMFESMLQAD